MKKKSNCVLAGGLLLLFLKLVQKKFCHLPKYPRPRFQVVESSIDTIKKVWLVSQDKDKLLRHIFISYDFRKVNKEKGRFNYNFDMTCYQQYVNNDITKISFLPLPGDLSVVRPSYYEGYNELVMSSMYISILTFIELIAIMEYVYELKSVRFYPYAPPTDNKKSVTSLMGFIGIDKATSKREKVKLSKVPDIKKIKNIKFITNSYDDVFVEMNPCPPHDIDNQTPIEI